MEEAWRTRATEVWVQSLGWIRACHAAAAGPLVAARLQFLLAENAAVNHYLDVTAPNETLPEQAIAVIDGAMTQLKPASFRVKRVVDVHAAGGHAFTICAAHIGLELQMAPGWLAWQQHHAATAAHASTALRRLRTGMRFAIWAKVVLVGRLRDSPPLSPLWSQWGPMVLLALCLATAYLDASTDQLRTMQRALVIELFVVRRLLLFLLDTVIPPYLMPCKLSAKLVTL